MNAQLIGVFRNKPTRAVNIALIVFGLFVSASIFADAEAPQATNKMPIIYDAMTFRWKPDLGLSKDLHFIYAWEATLKDEKKMLTKARNNKSASERTIEPYYFNRLIQSHTNYKYLVIDIESLQPDEDQIAIRYVELAKKAAPNSKVAWWNLGPRYIVKPRYRPFNKIKWQTEFNKRKALVDANDFCILGSYIKSTDTIETWQARQIPRIAEARRLYGAKPIFVTLAPHHFDKGKPWPFISGKLLGEAIDTLANEKVDGIVLWSFEGTGQIQYWDKNWDWVRAVRARTGPNGQYIVPIK